MEFDCRTCGACCSPRGGGDGYVVLMDVDVARLSPSYRKRVLPIPLAGWAGMLATRPDQSACVALRGNVGGRVSCRIYERRPQACRDFAPGSADCLDARQAMLDG